MKSIFLVTLLSALISSVAFAQTTKKKAKKPIDPPANPRSTQVSTMPVATAKTVNKTHFDRFYDRMNISYYGQYLSSPLDRIDSRYAFAPQDQETEFKHCKENCDVYATNIFSQITVSYNYGGGNKFFIQPRWTTFLGASKLPSGRTGSPTYGSPVILLEDAIVGFNTSLYASQDKKFSWNLKPALRLPVSRASRKDDKGDHVGDLTHQPDISTSAAYTLSENWSVGYSVQNRFWIYEDRYSNLRHRIAQSAYINQKLTDKMALSYNYEYWIENFRRHPSVTGKETLYKRNWQNAYIGLAYDLLPSVNVSPMIGGDPSDNNFGLKSMYFTASLAWTIK